MAATTPIDAHATAETRALLDRLRAAAPGDAAVSDVAAFDVGGIEVLAGHSLDGVPFPVMSREIRTAHAAGAVITLSWSSVNPLTNGGHGHNAAPLSVASVLRGGECHEKYVRWLDHLAMFIEQLADAAGRPIPLVLRLFHEHSGDAFWWSIGGEHPSATADEYIALWRFTVEYLSGVAGLHNVLYAISADAHGGYPGDDYVDLAL